MEKTHWKKIVCDPNYIGEWDFQEGEEKVLTIERINQKETVVTAEGKSQKAVIYWREPGHKPMVLNVTRSKAISKVAGSARIEDWPGVRVQLYVDHGVRAFGEVVSAVRVRASKPRAPEPVSPCTDCGGEIAPAMGKDAWWLASYTTKKYGAPLCADCAQKRKEPAADPSSESSEEAGEVGETHE